MSNRLKFLESNDDKTSPIWIIGIPYDCTSSYKGGSKFGPDAIRKASDGIESYSPYQNRDLANIKFYDYGNIDLAFSSPEKATEDIYRFYKELLKNEIKTCTFGGEHSITYPVIKAHLEKYPGLKFIHLDAHADMRDEYGGTKYSHASVIRRILELIAPENYYAFGIRSGIKDSFDILKDFPHFYPYNLENFYVIKDFIDKNDPIYVSLDLDIIDPGYFPGTGAPEPLGVTTHELHRALLNLSGLNIVGFDIVELLPDIDSSGISSTIAAFFTRELLLMF